MENYTIRPASINDTEFIAEAVIEAEKSGTNILSYTTIFGIPENDAKKYIVAMLEEDTEDCDLALNGFLIAEKNSEYAAALNYWIEAKNDVSSAIIKGNLLNYCLPKEALVKAKAISHIFAELSIDNYLPGSLWLGAAYVVPKHRARLLLPMLFNFLLKRIKSEQPQIQQAFCSIFANNLASIQNFKLLKFREIKEFSAKSPEVSMILPSNRKLVMCRQI
jgi:hypothetical protein